MAIVYSNVCDVGVPVELSVAQPSSLNRHFSDLAFTVQADGPLARDHQADGPLAREQADDRAR